MSIKDKIKKIINPSEIDYIEKFRKNNIPEKYNQIKLVEQLENEDIDHFISISNRTDGKSYNYLHYFLDYAIRKDVGFTLIARHYTVRFSYQQILQEIIDTLNTKHERKYFHFIRTDFYILVGYKDKELGIITDLNQATDLKYLSNYIKHFPIMIYDEFLALEGDYLSDEWDRLKMIYSSINRIEEIPHIKFPKIFYLGNAVNFSSPVLANLNLFNIMEKHKMNTIKQYDNIYLEMNRNEQANESRNLRAFDEHLDTMTYGEFEINNHNIADVDYNNSVNINKLEIIIKTRKAYMIIRYNPDNLNIILSVESYAEDYHFNTELVDNKEGSIYLNDSYYSINHLKKYNKDIYRFNNQFSKDNIIDSLYNLGELKIMKIIQMYEYEYLPNIDIREKQYKDNYIEQSKKGIFKRFYEKY